ncbi:hypothetical protein VP01_1676g4 [Puccinia sorghi]|uniref:OTU domain-containing protein n=1 Tax=Puccinia sorghi TaxID=27349 RepID=A0A0L6VG57_9BASI|nr:hypothetical protein VP01_1676g4 [Puccinia sorghi]
MEIKSWNHQKSYPRSQNTQNFITSRAHIPQNIISESNFYITQKSYQQKSPLEINSQITHKNLYLTSQLQSQFKIPPLPKVPELITELQQSIQPYGEMIYDVRGDGHCGYRVKPACLGRGPDGFMQIRQTILEEIKKQKAMVPERSNHNQN